MKTHLLLAALLAAPILTIAQTPVTIASNDMKLRLSGTLQSQASLLSDTETRVGFGVRRARLRLGGEIRPDIRVFIQLEGSGVSATLTDIRAEWDINPNTTLRAGRFVGAQPRSMAVTLHYEIDAIDRAVTGDHWASITRGADARDYGVELVHRAGDLEVRGYLHNGGNGQNITGRIAAPQPSNNITKRHLNISGMVRWLPKSNPNQELGAHVGVNPKAYGTMPRYVEASAHIYWGAKPGSQPMRVKADAVHVRRDEFGDPSMTGMSLFVGHLLNADLELFGKAEWLNSYVYNNDNRTFGTIGLTRKFGSWNQNVKAAYTLRLSDASNTDPVHMAVVQWQVYF